MWKDSKLTFLEVKSTSWYVVPAFKPLLFNLSSSPSPWCEHHLGQLVGDASSHGLS